MQTKPTNQLKKLYKVAVHQCEEGPITLSHKDVFSIIWIEHHGNVTINFEKYSLGGQHLIFLCPEEILETESNTTCTIITIPIDFEIVEERNFIQTFGNVEKCIPLNAVSTIEAGILYEKLQQTINQEPSALLNILSAILNICRAILIKESNDEETLLVYNFICLVHKHYKMHHKMSFYSKKLTVRPKHITEKFYGLGILSPHEFIKKRILVEAKRQLIYTNKTIRAICFDIGFNDPAYFSRFFKKNTGITAKVFKERNPMTSKKRKMSNCLL